MRAAYAPTEHRASYGRAGSGLLCVCRTPFPLLPEPSITLRNIPQGTSFLQTVQRHACPRVWPMMVVREALNTQGTCGDGRSQLQGGYQHNFHSPVPQLPQAPWLARAQPRVANRTGNVVTMLRRPNQRLLSAFVYMRKFPVCCNNDWGFGKGERRWAFTTNSSAHARARMRPTHRAARSPHLAGVPSTK